MKTAFIRLGRYTLRIALASFAVVAILYLVLFTSFGNTLVQPIIEKKLTALLKTPITVDTFILTYNKLSLDFHDTLENNVEIDGNFSLITLSTRAVYQADLSHLGGLNTFNLAVKTTGTLKGGYLTMLIEGFAPLFEGNIHYRTKLSRLSPSDLHLSLNNLDYQNLMLWQQYPHHSSTLLNGEIDLHGLNRRDIQGDVTLKTSTKHFSPSQIVDDNSSFDFFSLFADDQGKIQPFLLNVTLNASINELGILEQFAMLPLRGNAKLNATVQGDQDRLVLDANSNIAKSASRARVHWKKLRPSYFYLDVKHADTAALFHLFSKKAPTSGTLSFSAESTSKAIHYRGDFTSKLTHLEFANTTTHEEMLNDLLKTIP